MGQLYKPLTIGTAKPDWRASDTPHHLFDILAKPELFSVASYREKLQQLLQALWDKQKIPLIIGGSSYYVMALFWPPIYPDLGRPSAENDEKVWERLYEIDPERAQEIDPADTYRIARALAIWKSSGIKPSAYKPVYDPIADYYIIWIMRDREELYRRINERVVAMLNAGWIEEVTALHGTEWEPFLRKKKIIGYVEILEYLEEKISYDRMVSLIQKRTRNYAKRQITFWRMLKEKLESALKTVDVAHAARCAIDTVNLTDSTIERYSEQLKHKIKKLLS
jgi:tRNA dimethylallyltransferase